MTGEMSLHGAVPPRHQAASMAPSVPGRDQRLRRHCAAQDTVIVQLDTTPTISMSGEGSVGMTFCSAPLTLVLIPRAIAVSTENTALARMARYVGYQRKVCRTTREGKLNLNVPAWSCGGSA